jgi:hypothetical protein
MAGEVSYVRRFTVKFVEIVAAGIGTAVSGYLVAYITGHLSFFSYFMPAAVEHDPPKQAISWSAAPQNKPQDSASIEATVRAALAGHGESRAAPVVATPEPAAPVIATAQPTPLPLAPASPETQASATAVAPPLATAEIRSLPVAATADSSLAAEPDGWPSYPRPMTSGAGRLPPQPPPVNDNLFRALKQLF